jgi:hypothetical protein
MGFDKELISEMPPAGKILFLDYEITYKRSGSIMSGIIFSGPFKLNVVGRFAGLDELEKLLIDNNLITYFNMWLERTRLVRV